MFAIIYSDSGVVPYEYLQDAIRDAYFSNLRGKQVDRIYNMETKEDAINHQMLHEIFASLSEDNYAS